MLRTGSFIFLFLMASSALCGIPSSANYDAKQTITIIQRLTSGTAQQIQRSYKNRILYSEEWNQEWPLRYMKYFHANGELKSHGLMSGYQNVGTWHYYDSTGRLLKTADYNTMTQQLIGGYKEARAEQLERVRLKADSFMLSHFGKRFTDSFHVECEHRYYSAEGTNETFEWMDVPEGEPYEYSFSYIMRVQDSVRFNLLYFKINRYGGFSPALWDMPSCAESGAACFFNVTYEEAMQTAKNYPFADSSIPRLAYNKSGYSWNFYGPSSGTPNHYTYKVLTIDITTGAVDTFGEEAHCDHCEPVVYKKYYTDSLPVPSGYKRIYCSGIFMNVPETWIELEEYGKTSEYSDTYQWFDNRDTVYLHTTYGRNDRYEKIEQKRLNHRVVWLDNEPHYYTFPERPHHMIIFGPSAQQEEQRTYNARMDSVFIADSLRIVAKNDSLRIAYEAAVVRHKMFTDSIENAEHLAAVRAARKEYYEDSLITAFKASFPDSMMQGRAVKLYISTPDDDTDFWSIEMEVNNPHGGYGVGQTNYYFTAAHLTEEQFFRLYGIFKTARFLSYK